MTISYVGGAVGSQSGTASTMAATLPTVQDGDLGLLFGTAFSPMSGYPAGWTPVPTIGNKALAWKILTAAESATAVTLTGSFSSINRGAMAIEVYRGAVFDSAVATNSSGSGNSLADATTTIPNSWVVTFAGYTGTTSITQTLSGVANLRHSIDNRCGNDTGDQVVASPGVQTTASVSSSSSATKYQYNVIIIEQGNNVAGTKVSETDTARAGKTNQTFPGTKVAETDAARAGSVSVSGRNITGTKVSETDTARAGSVTKGGLSTTGTRVSETEGARAGTVGGSLSIFGTRAFETDAAIPSVLVVPDGDTYEERNLIFGEEGSWETTAVGLTVSVGEDVPDGIIGTMWFEWSVPDEAMLEGFHIDGGLTFRAYGNVDGDYTLLESGTDVVIDVLDIEGGTVWLQVLAEEGNEAFTLSWFDGAPAEHAEFEDALVLYGQYGSDYITSENVGSVWATFEAYSSGVINFFLEPSNESPYIITLYKGTEEGDLEYIEDTVSVTLAAEVESGETYYLLFDPVDPTTTFEFSWSVAPVLVDPAPAHEYIRVVVYEADGDTVITEIPRRRDVTFQESLNEVGTGSFSIALPDPLLAAYPDLFAWGHIVKFWFGDVCVHGFSIRGRKTTYVSDGEWSGYVKEISGPSVQYLLEDFMVRHDGRPRVDSGTTRTYSWASMRDEWYDGDQWDQNYTVKFRNDPPGSGAKLHQPPKWPDNNAQWMYLSIAQRRAYKPAGRHYYRKNFNSPSGGIHARIYCSTDERFRCYFDGEEVLSADNVETGYTQLNSVDIVIGKGLHTIALYSKAINSVHGGDGNDSIIFTMMKVNSKGKATDVIQNSGNDWESFHGKNVPGWNRAQVLRNCFKEARARGNDSALLMDLDFTESRDSKGQKWRDKWSDDVEVGTSALALQGALSEGNGFDVWVDPDDLHVKAYVRRGIDKSNSITLEPGRNLLNWEIEEKDEAKNRYFIQYDGGWTEYVAKASVKEYGDREAFITLDNSKEAENARDTIRRASQGIAAAVKRAGTSDLRTKSENEPTGGLIAVEGARPFLDFTIGDTVKAPNENGILKPHRIMALTFTEDQDGQISYDPDLEEVR